MVYCCVPFCTSKSGKSKGISFHDFPCDLSLQQRWLKVISRKNFVPNTNSFSNAVCSLHFQETDYKPGLKNRCLKPHSVPSIFPWYPSHTNSNVLPSRKTKKNLSFCQSKIRIIDTIPSCKIPNSLPPRKTKKNSSSSQAKISIINTIPEEPSLGCTTQEESIKCSTSDSNLLETASKVDSYSQTISNVDEDICKLKQQDNSLRLKNCKGCSTQEVSMKCVTSGSGFLETASKVDSYSQTIWNVDEDICKFKQQNNSLRLKNYRLNEKFKKMQEQLDEVSEKLNLFSNNKIYSSIDKVKKAADNNDDLGLMLMEQVLNFGMKMTYWDHKTLSKCASLRMCSPKAYEFIRCNNILKLPCKSTLSAFINMS